MVFGAPFLLEAKDWMSLVPEIVPLGDCKAFIPIEPSGGNIGTPLEYLAVDTPPEALAWLANNRK